MVPLVIGEDEKAAIEQVRQRAEEHPISLETLKAIGSFEITPEDVYLNQMVEIPVGFKVVYTHEEQEDGMLRHMSMSVNAEGRVPHPAAVVMVMDEFGFVNGLQHCMVWEEHCGDGRVAINVAEPLDGNWEPFRKAT